MEILQAESLKLKPVLVEESYAILGIGVFNLSFLGPPTREFIAAMR
jgi:hypothetical protein